ncbi:MAG TPA: trypsin-like peptidase domain-containing protein [Thermoleophilaceae bacterium]|jgi:putative serine protease PepD
MTPVIGRPPSDDPPPRGARRIWTGDWLSESERARRAAEEAAARLETEVAERESARVVRDREVEPEYAYAAADARVPRRGARRRRLLSLPGALAIGLVMAVLAFGAGFLLVGDDTPDPLPAVSGDPIKPHKGQTRAGAVYAAASPAVVSIRAGDGQGTGFLTDAKGQIVTNNHVVGASKRVTVKFGDGASLQADVLGADPSTDLAVLSVEAGRLPKGVKPLKFADSRSVQVGDLAIAIGNPFGLDRTATEGIVSGLGRSIEAPNGFSIDQVIQTDAPINPGNSGGPLLNDAAQVIGVNSQIATAGSQGNVGVGFAVPSNTVRQVVPRLARGEKINRGYLGVETSDALDGGDGAEVQNVVPGGPAERAGLRPGDIIKKVAGTDVKEPAAVAAAIETRAPGDKIEVEVERGGGTKKIDVTLGERPAKTGP